MARSNPADDTKPTDDKPSPVQKPKDVLKGSHPWDAFKTEHPNGMSIYNFVK